MVLVAPDPRIETGLARRHPAPTPGRTGNDLLTLLRGNVAARPNFEPGLSGGLRAWLEDAAFDLVARRGEHAPPLLLGPRPLLENAPRGATSRNFGALGDNAAPSAWPLLSPLVHALFRQLVHTGTIDDPMSDALAGMEAAGHARLVSEVRALAPLDRTVLAEALAVHAQNLVALVPRLAPAWMPRTDDRVAVPLAGGRIVLHGRFDLVVGVPHPATASLCALGLSTGDAWPRERRILHYLALLETVRNGTPPFRIALLESASGRSGVEDVRAEHLRAVTSHLAAWLSREAAASA